MRKFLKIMLFIVPVLGLGGWWAMGNVLPYMVIKPYRNNPSHDKWRLPGGALPENYGLTAEPFDVRTADSIVLKCLYLPAHAPADPTAQPLTVLVLHGIGGCKEHFLPTAQMLTQQGINVALFDLRAHGQSGGEYCTFGFNEKKDVAAVVDELLRRDPRQKIGLWGNSLGGAIALQSLAFDHRLAFGIVESTFNDLEKVVIEYGADIFQVKSQWLADNTLREAAKIAHFDPFSVKPCEAARQITQPMFMAHGDADQKIPIEFGQENFRNLASVAKEWHTVPGAGHTGIGRMGGSAYFAALTNFIQRQR